MHLCATAGEEEGQSDPQPRPAKSGAQSPSEFSGQEGLKYVDGIDASQRSYRLVNKYLLFMAWIRNKVKDKSEN